MSRILVVDDSVVMRRNLVSILTRAGHKVVAEGMDGGQGYNLYKTHKPDLVTMDITMPEVNGIEAVRRIMKDFPEAKIVMVSALDQKEMVLEAMKLGAKHYIIKPINPDNLIAVINKVLGIISHTSSATTVTTEIQKVEIREEPVEQEPDSPFTVQNIDSRFYINLTKLLSMDNIGSLVQVVQGLLYVQPLSVRIDFGKIETLPDELLFKLAEIVKLIKGVSGKVMLASENKEFNRSVKEKNIDGMSEFFIG